MKIIIERSGRSLIKHLLHLLAFVLVIYAAFTKDDPVGYILSAMWIVVSYVRYNLLVTAEVKLEMLEHYITDKEEE
jgi:hypothetical protein